MGQNLGPLNIKDTYQDLVQTSGSVFTDGAGNLISSVDITASFATTASYALNAETVDTGSLLKTASISDATTTYTKGDGTTFDLTVNNVVTANTASYVAAANVDGTVATATSASHALVADNGGVTKIVAGTNISLSSVGGTGEVTVSAVGGATVDTGSLLVTASIADAQITFTKGDASTFDITVNNVANATTAT